MKKLFVFILSILLINGFAPESTFAMDGTLDATCTNVDQYGFKNVGFESPDEQKFTPNYDRFTGAAFIFGGQLNGADGIKISLINSVGTVVGNETMAPTINGGPTTRAWAASSPISVRKGVTYKLRVENPNNADLVWYAGNNDCYAGGNAMQSNTDKNFDFGFSTYGFDANVATPAPTATPEAEQAKIENTGASDESGTTIANASLNTGYSAGTGEAPSANTSSSIAPPTQLKILQSAKDGKPLIVISWTESKTADLTGYKIFKSESGKTGYKNTAKVDKKTFEFKDGEVQVGKTYYYQVRAYKSSLESKSSNTVSKTVETIATASVRPSLTVVPITAVIQENNSNLIWWLLLILMVILATLAVAYKLKKWPFNKLNKSPNNGRN